MAAVFPCSDCEQIVGVYGFPLQHGGQNCNSALNVLMSIEVILKGLVNVIPCISSMLFYVKMENLFWKRCRLQDSI